MAMEMQDRLLQDYLLHLVGPRRVGRTHTGRVPPENSLGGRKGSLGRKNTSPSILARPETMVEREKEERRKAVSKVLIASRSVADCDLQVVAEGVYSQTRCRSSL